jgi:hypothetical protein
MRRRSFLRLVGTVGASGTAVGVPRAGRAARLATRLAALDRLRAASITVVARATPWGGAEGLSVTLGAATTARRQVASGALEVRAAPVPGEADTVDMFATFRARAGAPAGTLGLSLELGAWSVENYLLLPGSCYAGNRFESRFAAYPPLLTEPADIGPHVPPIVTDIPRLNVHGGPSRLDVASADLATPGLALFAPGQRAGLILLLDPTSAIGATGLTVAESDDRRRATIEAATPFIAERSGRAPGRGFETARGHHAPLQPPRPGEAVTLRLRTIAFDCDSVTELLARLFTVRKALAGARPRPGAIVFSAAFARHESRANERWSERPGLYALGNRESAYSTWQNGWCGGFGLTWPLLAAGDPRSHERALRSTAFGLDGGQAPSGFFHAVSDARAWYDDGFTAPLPGRPADADATRGGHPRWHLVRRTADTLFYLAKQIAWVELRRGHDPRAAGGEPAATADSHWIKAARRAAEALAGLWERHRQLGQIVDVETGELIVGGSSAAALAPAALAAAADLFKEPRYLQVARDAGRFFFERFVATGLTCGGPGDALQCPDSQSAAALVESFVTLYEATGDRAWVERARAAAHLYATWVFTYDAPAPNGAAADDIRTVGAVIPDAQNVSGGPGPVLLAGDALLRLSRATGDRGFLELLRDTARHLGQRLGPPERTPVPQAPAAAGPIDIRREIVPAEGLFDALGLLTTLQVPGVYALVDKGFVFAFDAVEARVKERLPGRLVLSLRNPTKDDARVRVLAEASADTDRPLTMAAVLDALMVPVPAGESIDVVVPPVSGSPAR